MNLPERLQQPVLSNNFSGILGLSILNSWVVRKFPGGVVRLEGRIVIDRLNQELRSIKEQLRNKRKWERRLGRLEAGLTLEKIRLHSLKKQVVKKQKAINRLNGFSIFSLFFALTGKKNRKLDQEKQDATAVRFKWMESAETVAEMEREQAEIRSKLEAAADVEKKYKMLLKKKERLIQDQHSPLSRELYALVDQETQLTTTIKEYEEAVVAGYQAAASLEEALRVLKKTKGTFDKDPRGGGVIAMALKRQQMQATWNEIHEAQRALRRFEAELQDIRDQSINYGQAHNLLTFADYFLDSLVFDWYSHQRIQESEQKAAEILNQTNQLLDQLNGQLTEMKKRLDKVVRQRLELIETLG